MFCDVRMELSCDFSPNTHHCWVNMIRKKKNYTLMSCKCIFNPPPESIEIRPVGDRGGRRISVDDSCGKIRLGRSCLVSSPDIYVDVTIPCAPKNRSKSKALISNTTKMWIAMGEQGITSSINSQFSHGVPLLPLHGATTLTVCYSDAGYIFYA